MDYTNCENEKEILTEEQRKIKSDYPKQYRKKSDRRTETKIKRLSKK